MSEIQEFIADELEIYSDSRLIRKLAGRAGVSTGMMYSWRDRRKCPTLASAERVLDAMGYEIILRKRDEERIWF